jgi:hypothetical protein
MASMTLIFLSSISQIRYEQGHNVMVALLPAHGKRPADLDMQDPLLADH